MPKRSSSAKPDAANATEDAVDRFEQEMAELEQIVARMEAGELRLEESLKLFERGTHLAQACRKSLESAELKVKSLVDASRGESADEQDAP